MKIKYIGYTTFSIKTDGLSIITDPQALSVAGISAPTLNVDATIFTEKSLLDIDVNESLLKKFSLDKKLTSTTRNDVFEIKHYGEYELGGVMIRKLVDGDLVVIDDGHIRLVYPGLLSPDIDPKSFKNLGDVDILLMPVGDGGVFPALKKIEAIISAVEPYYLVPYGYKREGEKTENLGTLEVFLKDCGYTLSGTEKILSVDSVVENEESAISVVELE